MRFAMTYAPLPLPSAALLINFLWVASWSYEPYFWLNCGKLSYYPSPDWSSAFCERWTNILSVEYTVYIHVVRYTSVSHAAKSFSWPFFVRYLSVKYALLMRFMISSHAPRRPSSPSRRLSSLDEHRIKKMLHFFCPFGVRNHYPLICDSTINVQHLHLNNIRCEIRLQL